VTGAPLIIYNDLSRLDCTGSPGTWTLSSFRSPKLFVQPASYGKQSSSRVMTPLISPMLPTSAINSQMLRLRSVEKGVKHLGAADSIDSHDVVPSDGNQIGTNERSWGDQAKGLKTTGDNPIERFGAALVPLGRRLAVVGGLTVMAGMESTSGTVYNEFCVRRCRSSIRSS
jgi:hypothetical protein